MSRLIKFGVFSQSSFGETLMCRLVIIKMLASCGASIPVSEERAVKKNNDVVWCTDCGGPSASCFRLDSNLFIS